MGYFSYMGNHILGILLIFAGIFCGLTGFGMLGAGFMGNKTVTTFGYVLIVLALLCFLSAGYFLNKKSHRRSHRRHRTHHIRRRISPLLIIILIIIGFVIYGFINNRGKLLDKITKYNPLNKEEYISTGLNCRDVMIASSRVGEPKESFFQIKCTVLCGEAGKAYTGFRCGSSNQIECRCFGELMNSVTEVKRTGHYTAKDNMEVQLMQKVGYTHVKEIPQDKINKLNNIPDEILSSCSCNSLCQFLFPEYPDQTTAEDCGEGLTSCCCNSKEIWLTIYPSDKCSRWQMDAIYSEEGNTDNTKNEVEFNTVSLEIPPRSYNPEVISFCKNYCGDVDSIVPAEYEYYSTIVCYCGVGIKAVRFDLSTKRVLTKEEVIKRKINYLNSQK